MTDLPDLPDMRRAAGGTGASSLPGRTWLVLPRADRWEVAAIFAGGAGSGKIIACGRPAATRARAARDYTGSTRRDSVGARGAGGLPAEEAQAAPDLVLVDDGGGVPVADAMLVS